MIRSLPVWKSRYISWLLHQKLDIYKGRTIQPEYACLHFMNGMGLSEGNGTSS